MKIKKVDFLSFGKLKNQSFELSEGVNIIYGNNESGKSTIIEGILTLLYGIYPTAKENNQLVNWDNQKLSLKGEIELEDNSYEISRELMSQPIGSVKNNNEIKQINNNTLEYIQELPLALFKDLYCLDTRMVDQLEISTWDKIDSEMIFSYNQKVINNPEDVIEQIDSELSEIWRESNRGNFRLKTIQKEIKELEREKSKLVLQYNETRDDINRIDELQALIKKQNEKLKAMEIKRRRIKELMPIASIYIEKDSLSSNYVNYIQYKTLPKDIIEERKILKGKIDNAKEEISLLKDEMDEYLLKKNDISSRDQLIINNQKSIQEKINEAKKFIEKKHFLEEIEANEKLIMDEYNHLYYKIFNKICTEEDFKKIKNISLDEIKDQSLDVKALITIFISAILGGLSYYFNLLFLSVILFSLGIAMTINLFFNRYRKKGLKGVKISTQSIEDFKRLKEKEFQLLNILNQKNKIKKHLVTTQNELTSYFDDYYISKNIQVTINYLEEAFRNIQKKIDENDQLDYFIKQIKNKLNKKNQVLKIFKDKLNNINNQLVKLSQSSLDDGVKIFKKNMNIEQQIQNLDDKLKQLKNSQLLLKEYETERDMITTEYLNSVEIEIDDLNSKLMNNQVNLAKLEEKVENVSITEDIQSIATEIDLLNYEQKNLIKEKNRLLAMREIIQKSNKAFKEDYQPDIIKDANNYFNIFTNSKYDKILINQETKDIYLDLGKYDKAITSGFSRGTMDQLYLALRLAIIKHYEQSIEMPLLLDEFFSNWDQERLIAFIKILESIKVNRQIIITTCKENIVKTLKDAINVNIIRIEGESL